MRFGFANWTLLLILFACGTSESEKTKNQDQDGQIRMHLGDSKTGLLFFTTTDIKKGTKMNLKFKSNNPPIPYFLPKQQADSIPFSLKKLPEILETFSLPPGSPQSEEIENSLRFCESPPVEGETKYCATSLESLLELTKRFFGVSKRLSLLTSTYLDGPKTEYQNFTILESPREVAMSVMIGCHVIAYPYAVVYCHHQGGRDRVYRVLLGGENGDKVDAVIACHEVIARWDPNLAVFRKIRTPPNRPLCHFFPPHGNFVWVYDNSTRNLASG